MSQLLITAVRKPMNESHIRNVIEAAMLAAGKPLQPAEFVELFDEGARPALKDVHAALQTLTAEYSNRGIEIKETAAGFRIQVRREMANEVSRLWPERPPRYSRALLETLALIAYRQPITRAEIEAVRGVAVNPNIIKAVIERNWVRVVGHRDVPGRPELLGTTKDFLDYFGLRNLDELPPLAELKTIGDIKVQFDLPDPGPVDLPAGSSVSAGTTNVADSDGGSGSGGGAGSGGASGASAAGPSAGESVSASGETAVAEVADGVGSNADGEVVAESAAVDVPANGESVGTDAGTTADAHSGTSEGALHEAEEFVATMDADLAAGEEEAAEDDELSAAGRNSSELVAGPRDMDD